MLQLFRVLVVILGEIKSGAVKTRLMGIRYAASLLLLSTTASKGKNRKNLNKQTHTKTKTHPPTLNATEGGPVT